MIKILLIELGSVSLFIFLIWLFFIRCHHDWEIKDKGSGVMGHPGFEFIAYKKCTKCGKTRTIAKIIEL